MDTQSIAAEVRAEIQRLEKVLALLEGSSNGARGRRRGKRNLSAKARKAISDAQKARWAKAKKAS